MSWFLSPTLTVLSAREGLTDEDSVTFRPTQSQTGSWLIFQVKNRGRQSSKRPLPTPSTSTTSSQSIVPSIEEVRALRNDAFSTSNLQNIYDSSAQSRRGASAPPFHLEIEPSIKRESAWQGDNTFKSFFKDGFESLSKDLGRLAADSDSTTQYETPIGHEYIAQGARLLSFFRNRYVVNDFIDSWFDGCEGADDISIEGIIKAWLRKLWLCHGEVLDQQDPDKLYRLSELVWRNTQTPLVFDGNTTALEWADLATGPNLRWEVVGILAAIVGICARYNDPGHAIFKKHNVDRIALGKQVNTVSTACVSFTQKCDAIGDLFVWLLAEDWTCTALVNGLDKYNNCRQGGEVLAAIVYLKHHHKIEANDKVPLFLAELRKRQRACAYTSEIGNASYHGRPPRASHHYWNLDPPADLTDKELMLSREEIDAILANMDEHGFSKEPNFHRGTWYRVWLGFSKVREDVTDLSLRSYTDEEVLQKAAEIERRVEDHWKRLPNWLREARFGNIKTVDSPLKQLYLTIIRFATRANDLLLQRVLIRRKLASSEKMVRVAQTIFKDTLDVQNSADMTSRFQLDITAILVVHGLRAAAIIASELFKQEQITPYPSEPLLPRSQTIQDLSVFASKLENVDSLDAMYEMSQSGMKMLRFVLDRILDPRSLVDQAVPAVTSQACPDPTSHQQLQPQIGGGQMEVDMVGNAGVPYGPYMGTMMPTEFSFGPPEWVVQNDDNSMFMQWLDSIDWERHGPFV